MKKLIVVLLSIVSVIVSVLGVAGCNSGTDELQSKIDGLQSQLEQLNDRLTELEEQIEQLEKELAETNDRLSEAEKALPKNYEVIVETTLYGAADRCSDFITVSNSLDEFKAECLRNGYDFFDEENQYYNYFNTTAGEKIREYTNEYFENKAFVVCAFYQNSWVGQYRIERVEATTSKLLIYIKSPRDITANDVVNNVFLIAGVDKSIVSGITELEYVLC